MVSFLDIFILCTYLIGIVFLGLWVGKRQNKSSNAYFLAGKNLQWPVIGAALFASNISTVHLVGLAASGYQDGLVWGNFEWLAVLVLILLAFVFAPFYYKSKIKTLPEFLEKRYDERARVCLAILGIFGALFIHIGVSLYAGAVVFENFFHVPIYYSIIGISFLTALYTLVGGLHAVVLTETVQTVVLLLGAITLTVLAMLALPDLGIHNWADLKSATKPGQLEVIPSSNNSSGLSMTAILLGYPILGIWYWCADQTIVQRVLGAQSRFDAKAGPLFAALIKILPMFIMVFPGVLAYVLFKDQISQANDALPVLIRELMPTGLKGLMAASLLAALMSTIAAALNSGGTLVSLDLAKRYRPNLSSEKEIFIGRITGGIMVVIAILWTPLIARFNSIFEAINILLTVISPPITAVFLWGVLWKRGNSRGAVFTFIGGFGLGLMAFLIDFPIFGSTKLLTDGLGVSFMLQAFYLFVLCSLIFWFASYSAPAPSSEKIKNLCIDWSNYKNIIRQKRERKLYLMGFLLLLLLGLFYILFG